MALQAATLLATNHAGSTPSKSNALCCIGVTRVFNEKACCAASGSATSLSVWGARSASNVARLRTGRPSGVLAFFQGASWADPQWLQEGTGAKLRHVKLRTVDATKQPGVRALVQEAYAERKAALR